MSKTSKIKQRVWARDKRCLICGTKDNLTVDHLIQKKDKGKLSMDNLKTLCRDCHTKKDRQGLYIYNFSTGRYEVKIYRSINI